jgi:hypothetical protein
MSRLIAALAVTWVVATLWLAFGTNVLLGAA